MDGMDGWMVADGWRYGYDTAQKGIIYGGDCMILVI
jgi:hypothetical protein